MTTIRKQPDSQVWVTGENVHLDPFGNILSEDQREFVWVDNKLKRPEVVLPFKQEVMEDIFSCLKSRLHNNFTASLLAVRKFAFYFKRENTCTPRHRIVETLMSSMASH